VTDLYKENILKWFKRILYYFTPHPRTWNQFFRKLVLFSLYKSVTCNDQNPAFESCGE